MTPEQEAFNKANPQTQQLPTVETNNGNHFTDVTDATDAMIIAYAMGLSINEIMNDPGVEPTLKGVSVNNNSQKLL